MEQLAKDLGWVSRYEAFSRQEGFTAGEFCFWRGLGSSVQRSCCTEPIRHEEFSVAATCALNRRNSNQQVRPNSIGSQSIPWGTMCGAAGWNLKQPVCETPYLRHNGSRRYHFLGGNGPCSRPVEQETLAREAITTNLRKEAGRRCGGTGCPEDPGFGYLPIDPQVQELDDRTPALPIIHPPNSCWNWLCLYWRQYPLRVGDRDFPRSLLPFCLRCFVVVDLKVVEFEPRSLPVKWISTSP